MKIELRVDKGSLRQWHLSLAERLARRPGAEIGFLLETGEGGQPKMASALFQIETLLFGLQRGGPTQAIAEAALARFTAAGEAYLVIDLAREPAAAGPRVWRVECDGAGLEPGLLAAAISGRSPTVRVLGPSGPLASARPGANHVGLIAATFSDWLERTATLIEAVLDGAAVAAPPPLPNDAPTGFNPAALASRRWAARAAKTFKQAAVRGAYSTLFNAPHWRVGWRRKQQHAVDGLGGGWTDLRDDGRRFYADPFPVVWQGRTFLFVEDFEHRIGKGIVSVAEFGAEGPLNAPEPALELPGHLSYPNVFERDGEMWMIPESCASGTVDLYRARAFPYSWTLEARLVENVVASDATLIEWGGRWWMFATVRDGGGSHSDALWLWSAPDFRGPWTAHPRNPVLIDIASARPAGRMFVAGGALYRPVQDCRAGYGAALGFARVDRLDESGFAQSIETIIRPGGEWPGRRLHTYNAAGGFEFIDGSAFAPRWAALRRPLAMAQRREGRLAPA